MRGKDKISLILEGIVTAKGKRKFDVGEIKKFFTKSLTTMGAMNVKVAEESETESDVYVEFYVQIPKEKLRKKFIDYMHSKISNYFDVYDYFEGFGVGIKNGSSKTDEDGIYSFNFYVKGTKIERDSSGIRIVR